MSASKLSLGALRAMSHFCLQSTDTDNGIVVAKWVPEWREGNNGCIETKVVAGSALLLQLEGRDDSTEVSVLVLDLEAWLAKCSFAKSLSFFLVIDECRRAHSVLSRFTAKETSKFASDNLPPFLMRYVPKSAYSLCGSVVKLYLDMEDFVKEHPELDPVLAREQFESSHPKKPHVLALYDRRHALTRAEDPMALLTLYIQISAVKRLGSSTLVTTTSTTINTEAPTPQSRGNPDDPVHTITDPVNKINEKATDESLAQEFAAVIANSEPLRELRVEYNHLYAKYNQSQTECKELRAECHRLRLQIEQHKNKRKYYPSAHDDNNAHIVLPKPKMPRTPLRCYMRRHVGALRMQYPQASDSDLKNILSQMWDQASSEIRSEMTRRSERDMLRYERELAEYDKKIRVEPNSMDLLPSK